MPQKSSPVGHFDSGGRGGENVPFLCGDYKPGGASQRGGVGRMRPQPPDQNASRPPGCGLGNVRPERIPYVYDGADAGRQRDLVSPQLALIAMSMFRRAWSCWSRSLASYNARALSCFFGFPISLRRSRKGSIMQLPPPVPRSLPGHY
jgi:hypothetical protein